jgi:hypothetical protein
MSTLGTASGIPAEDRSCFTVHSTGTLVTEMPLETRTYAMNRHLLEHADTIQRVLAKAKQLSDKSMQLRPGASLSEHDNYVTRNLAPGEATLLAKVHKACGTGPTSTRLSMKEPQVTNHVGETVSLPHGITQDPARISLTGLQTRDVPCAVYAVYQHCNARTGVPERPPGCATGRYDINVGHPTDGPDGEYLEPKANVRLDVHPDIDTDKYMVDGPPLCMLQPGAAPVDVHANLRPVVPQGTRVLLESRADLTNCEPGSFRAALETTPTNKRGDKYIVGVRDAKFGALLHNAPSDRFAGEVTLHGDGDDAKYHIGCDDFHKFVNDCERHAETLHNNSSGYAIKCVPLTGTRPPKVTGTLTMYSRAGDNPAATDAADVWDLNSVGSAKAATRHVASTDTPGTVDRVRVAELALPPKEGKPHFVVSHKPDTDTTTHTIDSYTDDHTNVASIHAGRRVRARAMGGLPGATNDDDNDSGSDEGTHVGGRAAPDSSDESDGSDESDNEEEEE